MRWQDRYTKLLADEAKDIGGTLVAGGTNDLLGLILAHLVSIDIRLQIIMEMGEEDMKAMGEEKEDV